MLKGAAQVLAGLQEDQLPRQLQGRGRKLQGCAHIEAVEESVDVGLFAFG